jgi:uncharacterized protein YjbI with pentapeptide repeats
VTDFYGSDLRRANVAGAVLTGNRFETAALTDVNLDEAQMRGNFMADGRLQE